MLLYRCIYVLNNSFNVVFGRFIIPYFKFGIILGFITSFFAFVRLHDDLDFLPLVMVSVVMSVSIILLAPMAGVMSSLYDTSTQFSRNMSQLIQMIPYNSSRRRSQIAEKQSKSCPLISCQIGNLYHMEAKAKLTLIHNVLHGVAYLMVNLK